MLAPLITAFRTLTILPLPGKDTDSMAKSIPFFPLVGLALGGMQFGLATFFAVFPTYHLIPGLIITLFAVVITGTLHLDGFADVADGFGGGRSTEQILRIFKDSRLGTFGTTALFFNLSSRILLISWIISNSQTFFLMACAVLSRTIVAHVCAIIPYVSHANSKASPFTGSSFPWLLLPISLVSLSVAFFYNGFPVQMLTVSIFSLTASVIFVVYCIKKIGGITGDCLGAINEITELAFLAAACFLPKCIIN